jgi:excisionase family DNA binding protein
MMNTDTDLRSMQSIMDDRTISTAKAAKMLGMSITMLQKMVDQDVFKAWKTPGGHRRIDKQSVLNYQNSLKTIHIDQEKDPILPIVKIIVDDAKLLEKIKTETAAWSRNFDISFWDSVPDAFLSFSSQLPDVLIVQTAVPLYEQISTVIALDKFLKHSEKSFSVLFLSNFDEIRTEIKQEIHESIQLLYKSMNSELLNVFLSGAYAMSACGLVKTMQDSRAPTH